MTTRPITMDPRPEAPKQAGPAPFMGPNTLAARLRKRRKELGWTQMHLAERVGTTQAVIQKIENYKSLRPRILDEIAESLGRTPQWLMYGCGGETWPEEVFDLAEDMRALTSDQVKMVRSMVDALLAEAA